MLDSELRTFALAATTPSVSLLLTTAGLDQRELMSRLRDQARIASERVLEEHGPYLAAQTAALLDETIGGVTPRPGQLGVAIFVNENFQRVVPLMVEVEDRVVIDSTFATRDLVRAEQRSPQYRVVTMSDRATRMFEGNGFTLTEVRGFGFPFSIAPEEAVRPGSERRQERLRAYRSQLDAALRSHHTREALPLVLVGLEPRLSGIANTSAFRDAIVATIRARCEYPDPAELANLVGPATDAIIEETVERAVREFEAAAGRRVALGISDVWNLANDGRGDLLLVEEGFRFPAHLDPTHNQPIPAPNPETPGAVDDLVDETIEVVLAKRGRCAVVPNGTLPIGAGVALKLRY